MTKSSTTNEGSPLLGKIESQWNPTKGDNNNKKGFGRNDTERTTDIYTSSGSYYKSTQPTEFSSRSELFDSYNENDDNDYENIRYPTNDEDSDNHDDETNHDGTYCNSDFMLGRYSIRGEGR